MRWLWGVYTAVSRGGISVLPPPPPTPLSPRGCAYDPRVQWGAQSGVGSKGSQKAKPVAVFGCAVWWLAVFGPRLSRGRERST